MTEYCEPIIDKDTFDRLQLYNETAPKEHVKPQGHYSKDRPLLSGLLYCGVCGKKAFLDRRRAKGRLYETYYCNGKHVGFRKKILDSLVIQKGIELLSDAQYKYDAEGIVEALKTPFSGKTDNLSINAEIAKIDRKIARISLAIEDSDEAPATLVKRLAELEKERATLSAEMADTGATYDTERILAEADRLRLTILDVLKCEKSSTDDLRTALSLFVHSVVIYPENRVLIRHTLPGMAEVASTSSGLVTAPPRAVFGNPQLLEDWFRL